MWQTLSCLANIRRAIQRKKVQATVFGRTYMVCLNDTDKVFLQDFEKARSGPLFYWRKRDLIHGSHRLVGVMLLG